jgi:hypothetical protein
METVEQFLALRRAGKTAEATAMLWPNAAMGIPWSSMLYNNEVLEYLKDEPSFFVQSHLKTGTLTKIDENTIQRVYTYDRLIHEAGNSIKWLGNTPVYREIYAIKDGRIRNVMCSREPRNTSLWRLFGFKKTIIH